MRIVIYIDVIFLINFMADLFVLLMTGIILGQRVKIWRLLAGAMFGAGILLPFLCFPYILMGIMGVAVCVGISMGTIAISFWGTEGSFVRKWFLSTTIMFLLGGSMYYFKSFMGWTVLSLYKWAILLGAGCIVCGLGVRLFRCSRQHTDTIYFIKIIKAERTVYEHVYLDTGNMLWDTLYQKPVILLSEKTVGKCLSKEEQLLLQKVQEEKEFDYNSILNISTQRKNSFHVVRYQSVGKENGWLVCFLADEVWIDEKHCLYRQPIAVAPAFLFQDKEYQGLLHKECILY